MIRGSAQLEKLNKNTNQSEKPGGVKTLPSATSTHTDLWASGFSVLHTDLGSLGWAPWAYFAPWAHQNSSGSFSSWALLWAPWAPLDHWHRLALAHTALGSAGSRVPAGSLGSLDSPCYSSPWARLGSLSGLGSFGSAPWPQAPWAPSLGSLAPWAPWTPPDHWHS